MNAFKRIALIVFGLAGALCLAALALPWMGPFQREATMMMDNYNYYLAVEAVVAITAIGVLVALLRGLFTPRKRKTVVIDQSGGDSISVTTAAISSQASHVVEGDGRFVAEKVRVSAGKRGKVRVDLRVRPVNTVDLSEEGRLLHDRLAGGLATICGDKINRVNIQFVEAENPAPAQDVVVESINELDEMDNPPVIPIFDTPETEIGDSFDFDDSYATDDETQTPESEVA